VSESATGFSPSGRWGIDSRGKGVTPGGIFGNSSQGFVFEIDYQRQKNLAASDPDLADVDLLEFGIGFAY
jgi:hypothetical protein